MEDLRNDQALAIVAALIEAKPAQRALEVMLGRGNVPDPGVFMDTRDAVEIAQWSMLLGVIGNAAELLRASIDEREVQTEFAVAEGAATS